jgi:uncharacterized protein YndB with AHSA1/START domain
MHPALKLTALLITAGLSTAAVAALAQNPSRNVPAQVVGMKSLEKEALVPAPRSEVWKAWTTPEGAQAFFAPKVEIELHPGGKYEVWFMPSAPEGKRGAEGLQVLSLLPERMFSFDWSFPPAVPDLRESGERTWVVIELADAPEGQTRVRLTQLGWKEGASWDAGYAYFDKAWDFVLGNLVTRFESGPLDWSGR